MTSYATVSEVAEHLRLAPQTLYNWRVRGTGPRAITVAGRVRYQWSDVQAWVDAQQRDRPR